MKQSTTPELFVGITSWNSEVFLPRCIEAVLHTTKASGVRIVVLDNASNDSSARVASLHGAEVIVRKCLQGEALNELLAASKSPYTLLLHADVVMLSERWFDLVSAKVHGKCALVSPEDVGCGPHTRPFGVGKPESSFMFVATDLFKKMRSWRWSPRSGSNLPHRSIDLFSKHVTHNLPTRLEKKGLTWYPMNVHASPKMNQPIYEPDFEPGIWREDLGYLRYGLGNFYSISGVITHYHNWYDRVDYEVPANCVRTTAPDGQGFPLAYIKSYTQSFLRDYDVGAVQLPDPEQSRPIPKAL